MKEILFADTHECIGGWEEVVKYYMNVDGYMAFCCGVEVPLGSILHIPEMNVPLCVIGVATREDAVRQWKMAKKITKQDPLPPPEGGFWYKVTTD
jgi:hypothetical protein